MTLMKGRHGYLGHGKINEREHSLDLLPQVESTIRSLPCPGYLSIALGDAQAAQALANASDSLSGGSR
jgi:hypothetical protein